MFVLQEVQKLRGVRLAQELERAHLQACREAFEDVARLFRAQCLFQDRLRVFQAARRNIIVRHHQLIKFADNHIFLFDTDLLVVGNVERDCFNFVLVHVREDFSRVVAAEGYEQNRRLFVSTHGLGFGIHIKIVVVRSCHLLSSVQTKKDWDSGIGN